MNLVSFLFKIDKYNKHQFDIPVEEQYAYMNSLGEAKDDIERSYKQYICQDFFSPTWVRALMFSISIFAVPCLMLMMWLKGRKVKFESKAETIAEDKGMPEIIPVELSSKYELNYKAWNSGIGLTTADVTYIIKKIAWFRQPFYVLKVMMQIASYSNRITKHQPDRVVAHCEFSFCSSVLTDYCHYRGVKLINVQHGEKLRYIRDAFFHFDECYVWDQHYVDMLIGLKAEPTQFMIAVPPNLKIDVENHLNPSAYADYKYYLAADNEEQIKSIVDSMAFTKKEGKTVKYRIHPRYTDLEVLKKYVRDDEIELPKQVGIVDSICNMTYAVGSYTTVMLQAYISGKKVLMDDVTYNERFLHLKEYGYILTNKNVEKLSGKQIF